jgi:BCD family chlorophyll transporter-like MFS transporter
MHERPTLRASLHEIAKIPQARLFFVFMVLSTLFLFLQQAVLTSFGGDVLGMSVRATTGFSAILTIGTIAGMMIAGRPFAEQIGHKKVALTGLAGSVFAFAALAAAAATSAAPPAWLSILVLGFASGLITVSSLALMMAMADRRRTALFMGIWTLAHALADGSATAGGGSIFEIFRRLFDSIPGGYASVFGIEAAGLLLCIPLLRAVEAEGFATGARDRDHAGELAEAAAIASFEPAALEMVADVADEPPAATTPKRPAAARRKSAPRPAARTRNGGAARARAKPKTKVATKAKPGRAR